MAGDTNERLGKLTKQVDDLEEAQRNAAKTLELVFLHLYAIQTLIEQRTDLTNQEVLERISALRPSFSEFLLLSLDQLAASRTGKEETERLERWRKVLESYEGPKQ